MLKKTCPKACRLTLKVSVPCEAFNLHDHTVQLNDIYVFTQIFIGYLLMVVTGRSWGYCDKQFLPSWS